MDLQSFVSQNTGIANVGDTPQNLGECVGLVEKWFDALGTPHVWGNAKDMPANADPNAYVVTLNAPNLVPSPGDAFCFDGYYGNGVGHTGIVMSADLKSVTLFQQNDPTGSTPHIKTYSYDHSVGWIHPKVLDSKGVEMVSDNNHLNAMFRAFRGREAQVGELDQYVGKISYDGMIESLDTGPERESVLHALQVGEIAVRDRWDQQISILNANLKLLNDQLAKDRNAQADFVAQVKTVTDANVALQKKLAALDQQKSQLPVLTTQTVPPASQPVQNTPSLQSNNQNTSNDPQLYLQDNSFRAVLQAIKAWLKS